MPKPSFNKASELSKLINDYFIHIEGVYHLEGKPLKEVKGQSHIEQKVWDREPEPPTISGSPFSLALTAGEHLITMSRMASLQIHSNAADCV